VPRCRARRALPGHAAAGGPADTLSQNSDGVGLRRGAAPWGAACRPRARRA